jgi:hypothetical protein
VHYMWLVYVDLGEHKNVVWEASRVGRPEPHRR